MNYKVQWITTAEELGDICPVFRKKWRCKQIVRRAELKLTCLGVYEAVINGQRIGNFVLAPGWTSYDKRLQYQVYDITDIIRSDNELCVTVGKGWFRSRMADFADPEEAKRREAQPCGVIAEIDIVYSDERNEVLVTDETWEYSESPVRFSEIYDGEVYDARFEPVRWKQAAILDWPKDILIPQEGEEIREMERIQAKALIKTPKGETVIDFGQELTGYVEFKVHARAGERIHILHGEVLDQEGNFYNENYRSAKSEITYICREGEQTWHPKLTFFGFRYILLDDFPGEASPEQFTAAAVYSDIQRTGYIESSDTALNRLFSNIIWGQKDNFLDVPTDCPQRDERLGWTGDAQVFVKTAGYNFDVERFFRKWLRDLAVDQRSDGGVSQVVPDYMQGCSPSAGWGDAAVICPWQIYQTYGGVSVLEEQFESMKKWIDYISSVTTTPFLWTGGEHFGDWLGLDAPIGSYKGTSREDLIASAFYAYSTELFVKAGHVIGKEMKKYEKLHEEIVSMFRKTFPVYYTQTEHVLAVWFGLAENPQKTADDLAIMIQKEGCCIRTGFIGTPYILHVLSRYGYADLAWDLLLRKEYPSWFYPVEQGATTIWEHWDGVKTDGSFWSPDMNSFNHYSYGAVADWIYEQAAGICPKEEYPGFAQVRIEPHPDSRLNRLSAAIKTRNGTISSKWICEEEQIRYEISGEMPMEIIIDGVKKEMSPGHYTFWGQLKRGEVL